MPSILNIQSRNSKSWTFIDQNTQLTVPYDESYDPYTHKHLPNDIIDLSSLAVISSPYRAPGKYIPGILILEKNKTYGRTENNKRLLYQCIPNDKSLPIFLVPYDIKLGFSKDIQNNYVLFKFKHWNDKHPRGELIETLGSVDNYDAYESYQIHCKHLHYPHTPIAQQLKQRLDSIPNPIQKVIDTYALVDRTSEYIFTIDNESTTDYDDALSITHLPENHIRVSVYISNVALFLDALDLWHLYDSTAISSMYLPQRKIPMLSKQLSEDLCSLREKETRVAFVADFIFDEDQQLIDTQLHNAVIHVNKNFRYESLKLLNNVDYKNLFAMTHALDPSVLDSHELVAYWMVKMNAYCGAVLYKEKQGIFRTTTAPVQAHQEQANQEQEQANQTERFLYNFTNHICSSYVVAGDELPVHHSLQMSCYTHITSPIRRMVDLINQILLVDLITQQSLSQKARDFAAKHLANIPRINDQMKSIRKLQNSCELLYACTNDRTISNTTFQGVIFAQPSPNTYTVYIEELKTITTISDTNSYELRSKIQCKIFVFQDEDRIDKKIVMKFV
jgi:exoribonuclease R